MKKIFLAMAAVAALLTSCSKDDTFGGPTRGKVTFEVSTPELATRAYGDGKTAKILKYAVYDMIEDANGKYVDEGSTNFTGGSLTTTVSIDLVEGRKYSVIFWAESENSPYIFDTEKKTVSYKANNPLTANNEAYDAFFAYVPEGDVKVGQVVNVTLTRPFAQINVATNDTQKASDLGVTVAQTGVKVYAYTSFDLKSGDVIGEKKELTFDMGNVGDDTATEVVEHTLGTITANNNNYDWLTMNYILVNERENVDVTFLFKDNKGKADYTREYSAVPVQRNHKTNIVGSILTDPTQFDVTIDKEFTTPDINEERNNRREVATAEEVVDAFGTLTDDDPNNDVDEVVLTDDIDLNEVLLIGSTSTINGKAQKSLSSNTVTRAETEIPTIVIDGNGKTISSSASRVIHIAKSNVNVIIKDLNVVSTAERIGTNDVRGIAVDANLKNVDLTLDNCSVVFEHPSANDWAYAVNVAGNGSGHKVTINGGEYEGANVVNVYGANNTVTVNNATLTSTYPAYDTYYGACIWVQQNQGSKVFAKGNTFNGDNAIAFNLGTGTELTESDNTDNCLDYKEINGNYSIFTAEGLKWFAAQVNAENTFAGKTVELDADIDLQNNQWTPIGYWKTFEGTFDGQNHTISNLYHHATEPDCYIGLFGCTNNATIKNLTIDNVDIKLIGDNSWAGGHVGALIGYPDGATVIDNVNVTGLVKIEGDMDKSGGQRIGSVIGGFACTSISMKNISVNVDSGSSIKGHLFVGGVAGAPLGVVTMENVTSNINVYSKAGIVGGIIGYANPNSSFTNVSASGKVTRMNTAADAIEEQYLRIGGIVGSWNGPVALTNCNFTGRLQANYPNGMAIASDAFLNNSLVGGEYGNSEDLGTGKLTIDGDVYMQKSAAQKALEAAIAAAEDGATVALSADLTLNETLEISAGKNITINLGDKEITSTTTDAFVVNEGATLTISGNGTVESNGAPIRAIGGTVIVEGGTFTQTGAWNSTTSTRRYCVDSREGGEVIINGGTFNTKNGMISVSADSSVVIDGGEFTFENYNGGTRHFAYVEGDLTVNDGVFRGVANSSAGGSFFLDVASTCNIQVNGGKFTSLWTSGSVNSIFASSASGSTIDVTGGLFNSNGGIESFVEVNTDAATMAEYPYKAK